MRCVYVAEDLIDAHLVCDRLCDDGIPAEIHGADLTGSFGLLPGYVSVWVPEMQSIDADHVLELFRPAELEASLGVDLAIPDGAAPA
ncbi:MAG: DUF2007 domain-containing protein [Rhodanobacteraceae bacterium]|jgi:hypothetical protein|nr:DUF2007 domain-containing protein [Rhodanobacteraceae bacterium]MBK7044133.1 DUF2007 domain-containing protein [Rhodanobacteraceae bacterium]MBP9155498.1 DUF2007 domain-containing protein [Xanthomonadales bacterium]HQW81277.1 DUF2007 domain-containing protein [Pseudomonadota bacterium]